ncbi:hypothetical protein M407DRAFT_243530, partial [Tulasnella calospora MUT 4182]
HTPGSKLGRRLWSHPDRGPPLRPARVQHVFAPLIPVRYKDSVQATSNWLARSRQSAARYTRNLLSRPVPQCRYAARTRHRGALQS